MIWNWLHLVNAFLLSTIWLKFPGTVHTAFPDVVGIRQTINLSHCSVSSERKPLLGFLELCMAVNIQMLKKVERYPRTPRNFLGPGLCNCAGTKTGCRSESADRSTEYDRRNNRIINPHPRSLGAKKPTPAVTNVTEGYLTLLPLICSRQPRPQNLTMDQLSVKI